MARKLLVLVGTKRGAFIVEGDTGRRSWEVKGPFCDTWLINHVVADPVSGAIYAGGGNGWVGHAVWTTTDLGASWAASGEAPDYGDGEPAIDAVWSLAVRGGTLYAGVAPAGLFRSDDDGRSWQHVSGLRDHPTRPDWQGGGAGLILHSLVPHPTDERQIWVGMSSVGVFHTSDGGATWEPRNLGTRADYNPEDQRYPEIGQCVHCLVMAPGTSERLYQQNHCGMYRSDDGGRSWDSIEAGLPSTFGFPAAAHPRDPQTLYVVPLNGDSKGRYVPEGKAAVWRTRDAGASWEDLREGLPQGNAFFGVLRQAMATDRLDPAGVYFGTNSGSLFASSDEGDSWTCIAQHLPAICSVETFLVEG